MQHKNCVVVALSGTNVIRFICTQSVIFDQNLVIDFVIVTLLSRNSQNEGLGVVYSAQALSSLHLSSLVEPTAPSGI